jgi:hypothetical protein
MLWSMDPPDTNPSPESDSHAKSKQSRTPSFHAFKLPI